MPTLSLGSAPRRLTEGLSQALAHTADEATAQQSGLRSFELEADELISRRSTQRAQAAVRAGLLCAVLLVVWAAWAEVDEVTRGDARVIPSRQLQVVQSLDGGVVAEILVTEGQTVEAGQLLLRIDETRATSGVRESAAQGFALRARLARLTALAENKPFLPPKAEGDDERRILAEERSLYESRLSELANEVSIVRQQILQRQQELSEAQARRSAGQRGLELSQRELAQTKPLLASGAVSEVEVLRLERDVSRSRGEVEQASAMIARAQAAIGESQRRVQEAELSFRNETRRELAETAGKLNALTQGAVALTDRVQKALVKSPVRGRVQRLLANTVGGVVQPGKDLVEIVPADDALILEARVAPKDIAFIRPQQAASVKFTAYDYARYGALEAVVENISPDTVIDERGNAYYLVRVRTKVPDLGETLPILPGMTAEVDVLTGRKSVLSYLLKPVLRIQSKALRER
jgi:adhesin transport system membrane fusion protein